MAYEKAAWGDFCPVAELDEAVDYLDTRFHLRNISGVQDTPLVVGMVGMINDEIVRVDGINMDEGYVDVARGCADTRPWQHGEGSVIWFFEDEVSMDPREYEGGEVINTKITPNTTSRIYPIDDAPVNPVTMNWRFARPYVPGLMQQNSEPWFIAHVLSADEPALQLTWAHRHRVVQADQLVDYFAPSIGPEPGTTYFARVYKDGIAIPVREEVGLTGTSWTYYWAQAINDFNLTTVPVDEITVHGYIEFGSYRDELESWQTYTLPFAVNNRAEFILLSQAAMQTMITPSDDPEYDEYVGPMGDVMVAGAAKQAAVVPSEGDPDYNQPTSTLMVRTMLGQAGQETAYYTPLSRNLFEAPYLFNVRNEGSDPAVSRTVAVAARPSDRLTDEHMMFSRLAGTEEIPALPFEQRDRKTFTPWVTIDHPLDYLDDKVTIRTSSLYDGVPVSSELSGQLAIINAEIVQVLIVDGDTLTIKRGVADTRPWQHAAGSRMWFFEAESLVDTHAWPRPDTPDDTVTVEYKDVPVTIGVPIHLPNVPTDRVTLAQRKWRPYPPGRVRMNNKPWFNGAIINENQSVVITWAHRNRVSQGGTPVGHEEASVAPEAGTTYKLSIIVRLSRQTPSGVTYSDVKVREVEVSGNRFEYTWEMAYQDGYRIARLMGVCGAVTATMWLYSWRDGLQSWQGYPLLLRLPAPACSPGQKPGGDSGGWNNPPSQPGTGGNGDVGTTPEEPGGGWDGGSGGGDGDPHNNEGGADDGDGPPPPDRPPEEWPDPIEPPEDEKPIVAGEGRWDHHWDVFWAAYGQGDDPAGNDGGND